MEIVHRMWSTGPAGTVASCVSRRSYRGLRPKWAAGLIGACLLFAAGLAAAADVVTVSQGQLYLKMGNRPHWEYNGQTQALNTGPGNDCTLKDSPQTLVATTGSPAAAGLLTGGNKRLLGIVGPGMNCGRIDPEESVTFALAGDLSGLHFSAVDIALNAKFNATAKVEIYDGSSLVATRYLYTGTSVPATVGSSDDVCAAGSADSSPDSDATNCRWTFTAIGNLLKITSLSGELGIGGAGSTSTFQMARVVEATGQIDCGDHNATERIDFLGTDELANAAVQCWRLDNVVPAGQTDSCDAVPYSLTASCDSSTGDCTTSLLYSPEADDPLNTTKFAFVCEAWWPKEPAVFVNGNLTLPKTQQYFSDLRGTDLDFCQGAIIDFDASAPACTFLSGGTVGSCAPSDIKDVQIPLALDHQTTVPGQQAGCLLDQRRRQTDDPLQQIKPYEMWYIQGDYTATRLR